jgi:hypothetical protein
VPVSKVMNSRRFMDFLPLRKVNWRKCNTLPWRRESAPPWFASHVSFGSKAVLTRCPRHVRFPPHNDRTADIAPRRRRANNGHHQLAKLIALHEKDSTKLVQRSVRFQGLTPQRRHNFECVCHRSTLTRRVE